MNIIQELRDLADLYGGCLYEDRVLSNDLHRLAARLEQSGALVPVPYGEPCEVTACAIEELLIFDHKGICHVMGREWFADKFCTVVRDLSTGQKTALLPTTIVQPVRLVPITEAEL